MSKSVKEIAEALDATIITPACGLVQKLAKIRREIPRIEKKGRNEHFKYDFMRAEDVAGDIGDKLAENNIILAREEGTCQVHPMPDGRGFFVLVECYYVFVDGDTGDRLRVWSCGAGTDSQDKGPYKAQTGALKYALTQALCMRVGHLDPEDDSDSKQGSKAPSGAGNNSGAPKETVVEDSDIGF